MSITSDKNPNNTSSSGKFQINYIKLFQTRLAEPISIEKMVNYVEIFESIYQPFLTINVNITDALSLTKLVPLIGEEYIEVDIRDALNNKGLVQAGFYVYKMVDRQYVSDRAVTYTLKCITGEALMDMNLKISKAYMGQPSDLVENYFCKQSLGIKKHIYQHPTKNNVSYISNYWQPARNIKYLCDRQVQNDTQSASYIFYENLRSFVFAPISALVTQDVAKEYFFTATTKETRQNVLKQQSIIHKLYVDENYDYIDRLMNGAYGNRTIVVNTTNKTYAYDYYDFLEQFEKQNRLNPLPFSQDDSTRKINSVIRTRVISDGVNMNQKSEMTNEWFKQRLTELAAINASSIQIDVDGSFDVVAGCVVFVYIPVSDIDSKKDFEGNMDTVLSGRYLVTGVRHMLNRERHTMSLSLGKDSLAKGK